MAGEGQPLVFPQPEGDPVVLSALPYIERFHLILPMVPEDLDGRFLAAAVLSDIPDWKDEEDAKLYEDSTLAELATSLAVANTELRANDGVSVLVALDEELTVGRTIENSGIQFISDEEGTPSIHIPATDILYGEVDEEDSDRPAISVSKDITASSIDFELPSRVFTSENAVAAKEAGRKFTSSFTLMVGEGAVAHFFAGGLATEGEPDIAQRMIEALAERGFDVPKL
jgi:hypothetical protein